MLAQTDFITNARWTDIMLVWFVLADDAPITRWNIAMVHGDNAGQRRTLATAR